MASSSSARRSDSGTGRRTSSAGSSSGRRNSSGTRSGKKQTSKRKTTAYVRDYIEEPEIDYALRTEILAIVLIAAAIALFLCNFGVLGAVGRVLSGVMFGLFGLEAYIMPVLIAGQALFYISNQGSRPAVRKIIGSAGLSVAIGVICELATGRSGAALYSIAGIYTDAAQGHNGGGVLFGTLAYFFIHTISTVGTVMLLLVLIAICLVLITERSITRFIRRSGHMIRERAREDADHYREQAVDRRMRIEERRQQRREEERLLIQQKEDAKILRMDKYVTGIADTKLEADDSEQGCDEDIAPVKENIAENFPDTNGQVFIPDEREITDDIHEITYTEEPVAILETEVEPNGQHRFKDGPAMHGYASEDDTVYAEEAETGAADEEELSQEPQIQETSASSGRLVARFTDEFDTEDTAPDSSNIVIHAGGQDYGNGVSEEGYSLHAQSYVGASANEGRGRIGTPTAENTASETVNPVKHTPVKPRKYVFPPMNLLNAGQRKNSTDNRSLRETAAKLEKTLKTFGVNVTVTDISQGPTVTRYEIQPEVGVKVSKIVNLQDDIKLNLAATDIRIEAPIPGKAAVGIEVPNKENVTVTLRELLESREFKESKADLSFAVGKDIGGKVVVTDIGKMPHVLIAGATGSGKSVCINTMVLSLIYKAKPEDVKMIMIDPKVVELSVYNNIPHLLIPVVTDPKKAAAALNWAVAEMTRRYKLFADAEVRDLKGYNEYVDAHISENEGLERLPKIVIIVDELADLMMVSAKEVEEAICRLAQLARACGIHLVIATQRPSVDVITGLIKANMPSRIAFAVSSGTDSRTILDMYGAEKLLGKGDMLFYPQSMSKPVRLQGAFVSDGEIGKVTDFLKKHSGEETYDNDIQQQVQKMEVVGSSDSGSSAASSDGPDRDEYFADAGRFIIDKEKASIGNLQRVFKIGFNRAARIMDQLCEAGVVGEEEGTKPRKVLMTKDEFEQFLASS